MTKITFVDGQQPYINATNLNGIQTNVETDIGLLTNLTTTSKTNLVSAVNEVKTEVAGKQATLTAGDNITIDENNVISATGGGGSVTIPLPEVTSNTGSITISALQQSTTDITITKSGYTPIGLGGFNSSTNQIAAQNAYISAIADGSITITVKCRNQEASQQTATITAYAVWVQNAATAQSEEE